MREIVARLRLWRAQRKALAAIAERECLHDGSDPMCKQCAMSFNPPP